MQSEGFLRVFSNTTVQKHQFFAASLLEIYQDKTIILRDIYTPMFVAALFTIAKTWKQLKCPSTRE